MQSITDQLNALLAGNLYAVLLIFTRVGTALMLMPGFAATYAPTRMRLFLALGISVLLTPVLHASLPPEPPQVAQLLVLIAGEALIGFFLGTISTMMMGVLDTAGQMIAQQIGLSNAYIFNPQLQAQGSIPGTLMGLTAVVLIFATDLYQVLLRAVVESYNIFLPGAPLPLDDMTHSVMQLANKSFVVAIEIGSPFMAVGLLMFVSFGLIGRLLPQIQVFFLTLPAQIGIGSMVFAVSGGLIMHFWENAFLVSLQTLGQE